jgi:hypothetical protein
MWRQDHRVASSLPGAVILQELLQDDDVRGLGKDGLEVSRLTG